eukprot:6358-Pleurochrysis_carterae.AAC.1
MPRLKRQTKLRRCAKPKGNRACQTHIIHPHRIRSMPQPASSNQHPANVSGIGYLAERHERYQFDLSVISAIPTLSAQFSDYSAFIGRASPCQPAGAAKGHALAPIKQPVEPSVTY